MSDSVRKMLREPLVHFLLAGVALFILYGVVSDSAPAADDDIVVTVGHVEHLTSLFLKTRQRLPTDAELAGLIDDFIVEEILYREAKDIGLDQNDTIIRRRLRQKMEFLFDDFSTATPTDDELQKFLSEHPDQFRNEPRITFEHVYLPDASNAEAETLLRELKSRGDSAAEELFVTGLIPPRFEGARQAEIESRFGRAFSDAVFSLTERQWTGPVESPFGIHLIFVDNIQPSALPALTDIRAIVERDWLASRRAEAEKAILADLRQKYTVTIEDPVPGEP
jgi:hypothetical protein